MRYYRTTGLILTQMQELVRRVKEELREPWNKPIGKPKSLGLYQAVEAACMYLRQNATQEFIGDMRDTSQPTISRYVAKLVPIVKAVLEEFVPSAEEAIEIVKGRVVLVDGTLAPCWSYEEHQELWNKKHKTTGFNAQLISLLDGTAAWISSPASREDARREGIQGDRRRGYPEGGRRRIRRQGLPGNRAGDTEKEAERRRTHPVRQRIQLTDLVVPRASRAAGRPLQELEDIPHRLPAPVLHLL